MTEIQSANIPDKTSNPAPLGLAGFGLTTILLNLHNVGLFPLDSMIMSMGFFYGGIAQIIVGIMEWKKDNTFGTAAFTSYGLFWISLIFIWVLPKYGLAEAPTTQAMGCYLAVWALFSFFLFLTTFKLYKALQIVFALLFVLFVLLSAANFTESSLLHKIAGYVGIICGASALYTGMAQVMNEYYKRPILPLGNLVLKVEKAKTT
jgi:succinate-acetate transporter protein